MTHFHASRAVAADAATGAATAAVNALRHEHFLSVLTGSLFCLDLTVSTCCTTPGCRRHGRSFSAASLSLLVVLIRSLVHDNQLVLLPVAGLGLFGTVGRLFEAQRGISAAVGLSGRVRLAVRSEGALRAANHTFVETWGQSDTTGLWMLNTVFFHGSIRPLKAPVGSCWSDDGGGETGVAWHRVGEDGSGLIMSHVGAGYLRA